MPTKTSRRDDGEWVDFYPLGGNGLDYETSPALAPPSVLVVGENVRMDGGLLSRRSGAKKVYASSNPCTARTFANDAKYATVPAGGPLSTIPAGGFAIFFHVKATRPAGGNTAYIISSRVNGQSYHLFSATLSDAGVLTVAWTKNSDDSSVSVATSAIDNGTNAHVAAIFDAVEGTFTVYIDGASSGTPVTGIASTEKPKASATTAWHFGVHYNPATTSVVANTNFPGDIDGFTALSLAGLRIADGNPTYLSVLLKHSFRQWPAPWAPHVLACYDFDDATTSLTDRSRHQNDGTVTGAPSSATQVALPSIPVNHVGTVQFTDGRVSNVIASAGRLLYEDIAPSA